MPHKKTLKECEELISNLQKRNYEKDKVLSEMRMAMYRNTISLDEVREEVCAMWGHHQDGSDLLVSQNELFDIHHNKIIPLIAKARERTQKPLLRLKEFIGW